MKKKSFLQLATSNILLLKFPLTINDTEKNRVVTSSYYIKSVFETIKERQLSE
jgi:hypothetical protein